MAVKKIVMARKACAAAVMAACASSAFAIDFETESGWRASLNTTLAVGKSWQAEEPNYGISNEWGSRNNWDKNDSFSEIYKINSELLISKGSMGAVIRAKAWYDRVLNDETVPYGNQANGFNNTPKVNLPGGNGNGTWLTPFPGRQSGKAAELSDKGQPALSEYDGIELMDAYIYDTFDVAGKDLQIRLGKQALNWGEGIFFQGLNVITPIDVSALRRPGTEIKEAFIPFASLSASLALGDGMSLEGFYQIKQEVSNFSSCDADFWAVERFGILGSSDQNCNMATGFQSGLAALFSPGTASTPVANYLYRDVPAGSSLVSAVIAKAGGPLDIPVVSTENAKDEGQWGLAFRVPVDMIDTEVGLYAMNYHSRTPILSGKVSMNPAAGAASSSRALQGAYGNLAGIAAMMEYPEDIRKYGLTATTTLAGWSMAAELSYSPNLPVQRNVPDMLLAATTTSETGGLVLIPPYGPHGYKDLFDVVSRAKAESLAAGGAPVTVHQYDRLEQTSFQLNGVNTLGKGITDLIGAQSGLFIGEMAFQWVDVPDVSSDFTGSVSAQKGFRYGRAFAFGTPESNKTFGTCNGTPSANGVDDTVSNLAGCEFKGYTTDFAWGYKIRISADYPQIFGTSWQLTPSLFWGHDVDGNSADGQLLEDRTATAYGLNFSLNKVHNVNLTWATFSNDAEYNTFRDRDNYSVSYSYTF